MSASLLIVDDEKELRDLLERHFRYLDYEVQTAVDGHDALAKLAATRFDIVISDIGMPGMNGLELLSTIRGDFPMVRVIMITGHVAQENVLACMRQGAETMVFKPLADLRELEIAVERSAEAIARWWEILAELQRLGDA